MDDRERERFDALLDEVVAELPAGVLDLLEEVPLIVDDEPSETALREILADFHAGCDGTTADDLRDELCGLHTGVPITERSVEEGIELPEDIRLFRRGVVAHAGGWSDAGVVREEIRVTILHEIGHHFGLDEDDLFDLGYE